LCKVRPAKNVVVAVVVAEVVDEGGSVAVFFAGVI
jgi:hypothetical protein